MRRRISRYLAVTSTAAIVHIPCDAVGATASNADKAAVATAVVAGNAGVAVAAAIVTYHGHSVVMTFVTEITSITNVGQP